MMTTMISISQREGILRGLYFPGLRESMVREMLNSGARSGFYVPLRNFLQTQFEKDRDTGEVKGSTRVPSTFLTKVCAAVACGALGAVIANPVDVLKIRMMAGSTEQVHKNLVGALYDLYKERGLMNGLGPSTMRGGCISVGELATYDQSKATLKALNVMKDEGPMLHIVASLITGLVATTVAAPFDLLKTRTMNASSAAAIGQISLANIIKNEGAMTLFRGWLPAYLRLGPHALICFPLFEQFRKLCGISSI